VSNTLSPAQLDTVRIRLEYEASRLPSASAGELLSFSVDPQIEVTFGKAPAGAFKSARGLLDYALAFANRATADLPDSDPRVMTDIDRLFRSGARREQLRGWLKHFLSQLHADRTKARKWVTKQLPDIWALPRGTRTASGDIELRFHILLRTPAAFMRFVVLLLAAKSLGFDHRRSAAQDTRGERGSVRKCARCGRFFLKPQADKAGGRPRDTYCKKQCMKDARAAKAIERVREWRRERRAKKVAKAHRNK
jgi:hypothetical protein